jgi:hypothetical protein
MPIRAVRSTSHIDVYDSILTSIHIIRDAERRRELDGPVPWLETGVSVEQLKRELNCLVNSQLFRSTEELTT